jgi:hypothetical protein
MNSAMAHLHAGIVYLKWAVSVALALGMVNV